MLLQTQRFIWILYHSQPKTKNKNKEHEVLAALSSELFNQLEKYVGSYIWELKFVGKLETKAGNIRILNYWCPLSCQGSSNI